MRVRHIKSSTVLVESEDTAGLCDPWIVDGAFYGAWAHYPPVELEPEDLNHADYIYISHIHPDHCHRATLERLDADIPVLIHDYNWDFLKHNVEAAGFDVRELPHDERVHLGGDLYVNVLASDDCDPEVCGNHFACPWMAEDASTQGIDGSTQIDSMAGFDDGEHTVLNLNDCRWPMSRHAAGRVKQQYGEIDLAMLQYTFAGGYPQSRIDYSHEKLLAEREERRLQSLDNAAGFLELLEPDYYMPFAGSYTLAGDLAELNEYVARSTRTQARDYFADEDRVSDDAECVLLNSGDWFDVAAGEQSAPYEPVDPDARREYIETELADREFTYESDPMPTPAEFREYVPAAYENFDAKRRGIGFESETEVVLSLVDDQYLWFTADGGEHEIVEGLPERTDRRRVQLEMDPRLTLRILKGPRYGHFNNAYIGSHLGFSIEPDVYERSLFYAMSFLHA
ncbi:MBL fold metallo-hydrolase [Natrinema sp. J7-1]|uniref:MBL fold metallo-hydrolase n=1 Tax=Natrinema sp. J7-1 TaxID=1172566 RepID=UPI000677BA27|nr:MBL fold metallo-hydrolase [Natrinema sp. J7-1]